MTRPPQSQRILVGSPPDNIRGCALVALMVGTAGLAVLGAIGWLVYVLLR